jgi:hypothetical protein
VTGLGELRAAVEAFAADDPAALPSAALLDQVIELRQLIDGLEGTWSRLLAAVDGSGAAEAGTSTFLRSSCRLAPAAARTRVMLARRLARRPAVAAALTAGEISVDHARVVTQSLDELASADDTLAAEAEAPLLAAARQLDPTRLRREIAHARHALTPEASAAAEESRHQRRHLDIATTFEGTVAISGLLTPEGGELLMTALTPLSGVAHPEDTRTPGQRRADALIELCHRGLDHAGLPTVSGERPHLTVLVPLPALIRPPTTRLSTLSRLTGTPSATATPPGATAPTAAALPTNTTGPTSSTGATSSAGQAGAVGRDDAGDQPGWWTGAGWARQALTGEAAWGAVLGPDAVRRIACDASVVRVVLDPAGQPLDVGRRTRVVPPAIRTALTVRDRGCAYPGCERGPQWTDAHHVRHWADGGSTSLDNLVLLCRQHHRAVHEGRTSLPHAPPAAA